ncbi:MAG TPA: TrbC/VirB2 family protein [Allosphingosinicella sp.]|nr:TrbC/VirB2 family protein [Allosphingosinicella sp.]
MVSLTDPGGSGVLVAAVLWLEQTLLGTIATTIAVIAVATVGLMMLGGRVDLRRGATVILGCFILFGASSIAAGIQSFAAGGSGGAAGRAEPPPSTLLPAPPPELNPPALEDPYAGAAVPIR